MTRKCTWSYSDRYSRPWRRVLQGPALPAACELLWEVHSPVWIVVVRFVALVVGVGGVDMIAVGSAIGGYGGWVLRLKR